MRTRLRTTRAVAVVLATAVSVVTAGPVLAQAGGGGSCAAMSVGEACARGAVVVSCCCTDAHPAAPAGRRAPIDTASGVAAVQSDGGRAPAPQPMAAGAALAPIHGYLAVPLHTLHSALLI